MLTLLTAQGALGSGSNRGLAQPDSLQIHQSIDVLSRVLNLSTHQKSEILRLWLNPVQRVKEPLATHSGTGEAASCFPVSRRQLDPDILNLLTDAQKATYHALRPTQYNTPSVRHPAYFRGSP